jgi:hypothetical protein
MRKVVPHDPLPFLVGAGMIARATRIEEAMKPAELSSDRSV